jgi:hypothetical protein
MSQGEGTYFHTVTSRSLDRPWNKYILALFPLDHLSTIVALTNKNLISRKLGPTNPKGDTEGFFGGLLLTTRFEF